MNVGNFLKEHQWEIIFAFIFALIIDFIFKGPIRRLFVSLYKFIRNLFAIRNFEQKYRDWLINKYRFLNIRGIKTNAPVAIELEQVFISLRTKRLAERMKISAVIESRIEEDIGRVPEMEEFRREEFLKRRMEEYETEKTYELKELFNLPQKRFIIIGSPGSGKTTLLNYIALKIARKSGKELFGIEDELLPIFINLRDTTKEDFLDIRKFVENYNKYVKCPVSPPEDFFKKKLDEGKCIILLDGLDEVAKEEQRVKVAKWVDELATTYSRNIFIATSRPYGYETARLYNDFLELHILDFTPQQVENFIKYWTKAVEIKVAEDESEFTLKEAEEKAHDLLNAIKENPKIEVLTVNPLLLTIVSLVHRYRAVLPKRRVELYDECCDVILGYWDIAKGIAGELQPRQKRAVLQPLAYYLHRNGLREEKREKFIELLENELPKIGVSKDKAIALLEDIRDRCGILVETKLGYFGFSHLTFQEFLTARYILDNDLERFLVTHGRDKYWLEVILLYCGMKDTTNLLNKILQEKDDIFYTNLFLAGRCIAESLSVSPELRNKITQRLYDIYWDENEFNLSKETSLEILKEIKNPQIIQKLIQLLKDKERDVRGSAAYVLGQIQAKEAVPQLLELLKDKERDVRVSAASALGQIQAKEAVPQLMELLKDEDSLVRGSAASALGQIQAKEEIPQLMELLKDKKWDVREGAAFALGEMQAKEAVPQLLELLKDKDSKVRGRAVIALGQMQAKEAVPSLIELLKDKESYAVRGSAAGTLGQIQAKEAAPQLLELLRDEYSYVRFRAAYALGQINAKEAVPSLIELLKDKSYAVRSRAAETLCQIQTEEAVPQLLELLKDEDSIVIGSAADALGRIRPKEAVPQLLELLKNKDWYVRGHVAFALGQMQAKEALPQLMELLKDKESYVRWGAASALGRISDRKALGSLKPLLNDEDFRVRNSAFSALKEISEKTGTPIYRD